jgi:sialidase-1
VFRLISSAVTALALFAGSKGFADNGIVEVNVFTSGSEGYHTFRIPAIVRGTNGTLLAFAEGRKNSSNDTGDIDLVLKRSFDNGHTWEPLQVIGDDGPNTFGNPVPIVDTATGRVLLLTTHNAGKVSEAQVVSGTVRDRRVFVQTSTDNGATWNAARDITPEVKRPDWRGYATGPGHGIELARGHHAGRLIAPCDHTTSVSTSWSACGAHLIYSDDGGTSWRIGAQDSPGKGLINPNESTAVELIDGQIYMLARNQEGRLAGHRAFAYSRDGGATFAAPFAIEPDLGSPVVEACLLRISALDQGGDTNRILFSAPGDAFVRKQMTVRCSFDEARTWSPGKVIYEGPSAYSDLVKLPGGRVGLLYESGVTKPYERIAFAVFDVRFLDSSAR